MLFETILTKPVLDEKLVSIGFYKPQCNWCGISYAGSTVNTVGEVIGITTGIRNCKNHHDSRRRLCMWLNTGYF